MRLGDFIRLTREARGLSLRELSSKSGVSHAYVSQLETGVKVAPSPRVIAALAKTLEVDEDEISALVEMEKDHGHRIERLRDLIVHATYTLDEHMRLTEMLVDLVNQLDSRLQSSIPRTRQEPVGAPAGPAGPEVRLIDGAELALENLLRRIKSDSQAVRRTAERLNRQLPSVLKALEERLRFPRYPTEAERLLLKADSLGAEGISWTMRLLELVEELLAKCARTKHGVPEEGRQAGDSKDYERTTEGKVPCLDIDHRR